MSLATKIFLGFSVLLATCALLAFLSVREIRAVAEDLRAIRDGHLALARTAAQLETHQQNRFRDLRRALQEGDARAQEVILRIAVAYFPDVIRATAEEARRLSEDQIEHLGAIGATDSAGKIEFYRGIEQRVDRIILEHEALDELTRISVARVRQNAELAANGARGEPLDDVLAKVEQAEVTLRSEAYQLNKYINDETDRAVRRAEQDERNAVWRVVVMTGIALFIGLLLTFLSARALAPIGRLVRYARAISRGDYEQSVVEEGDDELSLLAAELQQMARSRKDREAELDRQAAELELAYRRVAELKRYHESVVQSLRTAVVVTDRELRVTSTNRAAGTHWGLAAEIAQKRSLEELALAAPLVAAVGPLSALLARAETVNIEAVPLGDLLADVTIAPFQNERKDVLGLVIALEDVTDAVRTKEALIRSERLAAIGRMSAHVTHEIRNPLSSIGLNAELLLDLRARGGGGSEDEAQVLCRSIIREVDRLTAITDEYLRFARLPRPQVALEDPGALLGTIAAFVRRDLAAAQITLELDVAPALPPVPVDADQMRQAVLNLIRNAKEAMPRGGTVVVGAEAEGHELALFVRDSGHGIPKEHLGRIFDPFYSTKLTGTGLGLALTQQIVTEHGGIIRVSSDPGQGSEFRIVMPVPQRRVETAASAPEPLASRPVLDG